MRVSRAAAVAAIQVATDDKNLLWVSNLPAQTGKDDFMASFASHKALECVTMRVAYHGYTIIIFRCIAECRTAPEELRGCKVKGAFILILFARLVISQPPSRPTHICSHLGSP